MTLIPIPLTNTILTRPSCSFARRPILTLAKAFYPVPRRSPFQKNFSSSCSVPSSSPTSISSSPSDRSWLLAPVPDRSVLHIYGRDTVKLFQGLISNDVSKLQNGQLPVLFGAFMNPQGRMLADAFIHCLPSSSSSEPDWLLETDSRTILPLLSFIKRFKLRSKVTLQDVSDEWKVVQLWDPSCQQGKHQTNPSSEGWKIGESSTLFSPDPRAPGMGWRGIVKTKEMDMSQTVDLFNKVDQSEYTVHRILHGVAEGALDFASGSSMPLENNIDYMAGVDFRKGCYVGQELTARTHHRGVIRKRLLPFTFYSPDQAATPTQFEVDRTFSIDLPTHLTEVRSTPLSSQTEPDKPISRGRATGKFTSGIYNIGLGCLRLEQVVRWQDPKSLNHEQDALQLSIQNQLGETLYVRPWIPDWWPEKPTKTLLDSEQ